MGHPRLVGDLIVMFEKIVSERVIEEVMAVNACSVGTGHSRNTW